MKRVLLVLMIALMMAGTVVAQNGRFGKPSQEEWELTSVDYAPDASAVVLYKSVDVQYNVSSEFMNRCLNGGTLDGDGFAPSATVKYFSPDGSSILYEVKVRIKILKDTGAEYASMDIVTYNEKEDMFLLDDYHNMSVVVFNKVDGKVKKRKIRDFKDERLNDHYFIRHVRVPDVKAGDIIEYQYKLFSNRITYIYNTQMQEGVPVLYSGCRMEVPYFLQFNVNKPEHPNVKADVRLGGIMVERPSNDRQAPKRCASNVYEIEARNLPAFDGVIDQQNVNSGKVLTVRTELKEKTRDAKSDPVGPVRHLIIGK